MSQRISKILEQWSLREPALTSVYYTHTLVENDSMKCYMRVGKRKIEYNPELINLLSDPALEEKLKVMVLRICLKYPYERQPYGCSANVLKAASDLVLAPVYTLKYARLYHPNDFGLPVKKHFEWYAYKLMDQVKDAMKNISGIIKVGLDDGNVNVRELTPIEQLIVEGLEEAELWEEDEEMQQEIKERIEQITNWGSIPHDTQEAIMVAQEGRIDYRKILRAFSTSVVSSERVFTRMRPNRRLGYKAMGSKHDMESRLLVAVDVSGSVENRAFAKFFRIITHFFRYGVESTDVIQFDCEIKKEVLPLNKASEKLKEFNRLGNGGTDFQIVVDYYHKHRNYDALIIFTDGYAEVPSKNLPPRSKLLWIIDTEDNYNHVKDELSLLGRICYIM